MTHADHTIALPTLRRPAKRKSAPVVAKSAETLKIACWVCGRRGHEPKICSLAIIDEKTGVVS